MTRRIGFTAVLLSVSVVAIAVVSGFGRTVNASGGLVAHEWGTFTSIAGEDGRAVQWLPQAGPTDLPCFVERVEAGSRAFWPAPCGWKLRSSISTPLSR